MREPLLSLHIRTRVGLCIVGVTSCLSMAAIDSLLSLDIVHLNLMSQCTTSDTSQIKSASLLFHSAKELRTHTEILPGGPHWLCEPMAPDYPVKKPICLFYQNAVDCLQTLLSHPLFEPHISFVPRKVWGSTIKICCIYDEWLSGDCAWEIQVGCVCARTYRY